MVRGPGYPEWQYRILAIDVQGRECQIFVGTVAPTAYCFTGQPRLYLEDAGASHEKKKPGFKLLGVQWR